VRLFGLMVIVSSLGDSLPSATVNDPGRVAVTSGIDAAASARLRLQEASALVAAGFADAA